MNISLYWGRTTLHSSIFSKSFSVLLLSISLLFSQTPQIDSLKSVLPGSAGKERLAVLYELSNRLEMTYPKEALEYGLEGIAIAEHLGDSSSLATLYSSAGFSSSELGNFEQSIHYGNKSLDVATRIGNARKIASANSALGITYVYLGQFSKALEYHLTALRIREELGLQDPQIRTLNNIGLVYHNIGQYDKAIEYYKRAYEKQSAFSQNKIPLIRFLTNIGFSEFKRGNIAEALRYHKEALAIADSTHYIGGTAYTLFNLGIMNVEMKNFEKGIGYLHQALEGNERLERKYGMAEVLTALGEAYYESKNYPSAVRYLLRAAELSKEVNAPGLLEKSYQVLSSVYEIKGETASAFRYYKLYSAAKDSLNNSAESKKIAELLIKLEISEKEREIELLKKEKTISSLTLEQEKSQFRFTVGVIGFLVVVIGLLFFNNRKTTLSKRLVDEKNKELETLAAKLQEQIAEVKALSGLLPICSHCKKIRDDKGYWKQLEVYISSHSEAKFSHSICPNCMEELYPEVRKINKPA